MDNTKIGKKEEPIAEKMNRSPDERHKQTQGSFTDIFQQSQMSFSIKGYGAVFTMYSHILYISSDWEDNCDCQNV